MRGPELLTYDLGQGACAFSTERRGGYSEGAYASFNANAYCGDDERMVRLNRDLLCESLGLETSRLIIPHQVHGARVRRIDEAFFMQTDAVKAATLEGVDAVMTDVPKVCVSVSTADCIPILIYDRVHHAVATHNQGVGFGGSKRFHVVQNARETLFGRKCSFSIFSSIFLF